MSYIIPNLPITTIEESSKVLKKLISANRALAELKGVIKTIPNQEIILHTLALQESKSSSEIEQIVTTHDEIYKIETDRTLSKEAKEVQKYSRALKQGFTVVKEQQGISCNNLITLVKEINDIDADYRKTDSVRLKNQRGEVIYTPPQGYELIKSQMNNLEKYINNNDLDDLDPLVKMAIIHHQFESIHPFYDGNGRVGRILNVLYLVLNNLLDIPVLYISGYIISNKERYYHLLQDVRDNSNWEEWILFMLDAIEQTSLRTISTVSNIKELMLKQKHIIREQEKNIYSQELINIIFSHPYTKIEYLVNNLEVSRDTASRYLKKLNDIGLLHLEKRGRISYYVNTDLLSILKDIEY